MKDAETFDLPLLAEIPIKIDLRQAGDDGAALGHRLISRRPESAGAVLTLSLARSAKPHAPRGPQGQFQKAACSLHPANTASSRAASPGET